MIKNKKGQAADSTMKSVSPDRQASGLMKCYIHAREDKDKYTSASFKSRFWFYSFPFGPFFLLTSSFLMSVFIVHVTVWRCLPSDRFLYTPLHISEPTPSVLILSASSLTQTVAESMSIQFAKHFKWYVAALHYCSIFPSQWGRLLFSSDAHSTFSHVSSLSLVFILILLFFHIF